MPSPSARARVAPPRARMASAAAAIAAVLGLCGCTVGPDYATPSLWTPSSWFASSPADPRLSLPAPEPVDPRWWAAFNDPMLTALVEQVAAENLDVRLATIRLAESRQQRRITAADEFPQIQGSASYTRERLSPRGVFSAVGGGGATGGAGGAAGAGASSPPSSPPSSAIGGGGGAISRPFDLWQYGLDSSYELDLWGRVRRAIEAADATVDSSAEDRRNTLLSSLAEVARLYIQLRDAQAQLAISRDNERTAQSTLQLASERFRGGLTSELDVANAAAQLATTRATIPQLVQQEAQTINQLSFLLGRPPRALEAQLRTAKPVPPVPPSVPVGLPSELTTRRPDIRMADARLHAATAQIGVAEANFFPSVTLSGNLSIQAVRFANLGNWDSRTYGIGPAITIPLFQGGRLRAQLELNKAQQREAAVTYQRTVLNAFHEVDNAMVAYSQEQARHNELQVVVNRNGRALQLAQQRYRDGLSTFLDVLDAQRQVLAAQQQLATSTATISTNLVALYKALGGGWETQYPPGSDTKPLPVGFP